MKKIPLPPLRKNSLKSPPRCYELTRPINNLILSRRNPKNATLVHKKRERPYWETKPSLSSKQTRKFPPPATNMELPSPDGHTQTRGNWCRQHNTHLHRFPKQPGAVRKLIMAANLIIQQTKIPTPDNHITYTNNISAEKRKPRYINRRGGN